MLNQWGMRLRKYTFLYGGIIALGILVFSCKNHKVPSAEALFFSDSLNTTWSILDCKSIIPVGNPMIVKDSVIILAGHLDGKFLHCYNIGNGELLGSYISLGQGPDEIINPWTVNLSDTISIFDLAKKSLMFYDKEYNFIKSVSLSKKDKPMSVVVPVSSELAIFKVPLQTSADYDYYGWEMSYLSNPNKTVSRYDDLPSCVENNPRALGVINALMVLSPDKKHFAYGTTTGGVLQTFDISNNSFKPIISEYLFPVEFDADGKVIRETRHIGFTALTADNSYLYGAFAGTTDEFESTKIGIWNWDGTPELLIKTNAPILSMTKDEMSNKLYALIYENEEFKLAYISMPD